MALKPQDIVIKARGENVLPVLHQNIPCHVKGDVAYFQANKNVPNGWHIAYKGWWCRKLAKLTYRQAQQAAKSLSKLDLHGKMRAVTVNGSDEKVQFPKLDTISTERYETWCENFKTKLVADDAGIPE